MFEVGAKGLATRYKKEENGSRSNFRLGKRDLDCFASDTLYSKLK